MWSCAFGHVFYQPILSMDPICACSRVQNSFCQYFWTSCLIKKGICSCFRSQAYATAVVSLNPNPMRAKWQHVNSMSQKQSGHSFVLLLETSQKPKPGLQPTFKTNGRWLFSVKTKWVADTFRVDIETIACMDRSTRQRWFIYSAAVRSIKWSFLPELR